MSLVERDFPDKEFLQNSVGAKRNHSEAFKEPERVKQQTFKFKSIFGEKLPVREKEQFTWDSTSSEEEDNGTTEI